MTHFTAPMQTDAIHGLGYLSTISYNVDGVRRVETMFITNGTYIECPEADTFMRAVSLASDLRAMTPSELREWVKERMPEW